ncbi:hypothetical protein B0J18DRAFT_460782 [Chaetomium sp. MPI-SDFR-AT-0129]|nr:hypothetical protein B0J18DRAFT_460782 [Chaetomium sp. MPI-SDFR-AT-0129]
MSSSTTNPANVDEDARTNLDPTPLLFNDVYFERHSESTFSPSPFTWAPFSRLPAELRLHIWKLSLQQHRMIEVDILTIARNDIPQYTNRNHLGRIISDKNYTRRLRGRESYALSLTPLLRVSHEARAAALSFYHIHLPLNTGQVLYLNSEYDVVYARPRHKKHPVGFNYLQDHMFLLVDFLHDVRAYDHKDHGITRLALDGQILNSFLDYFQGNTWLTPDKLHPTAAASFAAILRHKLHTLFYIVDFRYSARGMGPNPFSSGWRTHFAQSFPIRRRGHVVGGFQWFPADPRPGVALDLRQVPLWEDPRTMLQGWRDLERVFFLFDSGVPAGNQQQAAATSRESDDDGGHGGCRVYICPTQKWPTVPNTWPPVVQPTIDLDAEHEIQERAAEREAVWSRDELRQHFRDEVTQWEKQRANTPYSLQDSPPDSKYSTDSPEEMEVFLEMEKLPCTAIGMWLMEAEAFPPPTDRRFHTFNLSSIRPGLLLFQV